jgi:hypothetical protein
MASESDHVVLANHNHGLLLHLLQVGGYSDWAATVAFYKAVHVVEAVFAASLGKHSVDHSDRLRTLKMPRLKSIFRDYTHLFTASLVGRYLVATDAGEFSRFSDFMDEDDVKKLIRKRLYGVEQHALRFVSTQSKVDLVQVDPSKI